MISMLFFFFVFLFLFVLGKGVYLNWVLGGQCDAVFCKSKDFKAFLRCSCVHFFQFAFAIKTIIICMFFFL